MARQSKKNITQEGDTTKNVVTPSVEKADKPTTKAKKVAITDDEEIEVVSLIPNVSYFDKATDDTYKWKEVDETLYLPFGVIKNMWRNHKGFLKNFCLKLSDKRAIENLGLTKVYEKYDFLTDASQYTVENLNNILETIDSADLGLKTSVCNRIKNLISQGKIENARVIFALDKKFDADLISLL